MAISGGQFLGAYLCPNLKMVIYISVQISFISGSCHDTLHVRFQKLKQMSIKMVTGNFEFPATYKKSCLVHFMIKS